MSLIDKKNMTAEQVQYCWDYMAEAHQITSAWSDDTDDLTFDFIVNLVEADGAAEDDVNHVSIHITITGEHRGA